MGRRARDLMDPALMNPEQLTSTSTKQDLLNEEIQKKLPVQTHLEIQQREDVRRDLAERMKFVPDLRVRERVCHWQEDPSKIQQGRKSGKWLKVEIIAVKGTMAVISTGASICHVSVNKIEKTFGHTVDLEESPESRERTGAPVLWLSNGEVRRPHWTMMCQRISRERSEDVSILCKNPDGEALQGHQQIVG